jgi:type I restriction enzyme S subunit
MIANTSWPVKTLGDVATITTGKIDVNAATEHGAYPFFTCSRDVYRIDSAPFEGKAILVAGNGDLNIKYYEGRFNAYQRTYILFSRNEIDCFPRYLYWFLESHLDVLRSGASGSTIKYIRLGALSDASIPVPPLEEQKRIVALLDAATARVTELTACYEQARTHANNLFASELTEIFEKCAVDTSAKQLSIREICKIGDGNHSAKYPKSSEFVVKGVPFIRANNISNGKISVVDMRYISEKKHFELKKGHLRDGDVLITNRGEIGSLAIVGSEFDGANLNSQIAWLRVSALVTNRYLYYFLCSQNAKAQFFQGTTGAALQQLTISQLREIRVPIVPLTTQQTVIDHLDKLKSKSSEMVAAYDAKLAAAKNLRQSILEAAFGGDL